MSMEPIDGGVLDLSQAPDFEVFAELSLLSSGVSFEEGHRILVLGIHTHSVVFGIGLNRKIVFERTDLIGFHEAIGRMLRITE